MSNPEKLRECPFCGALGEPYFHNGCIVCTTCEACGPWSSSVNSGATTVDEAANLWNTRALDRPLPLEWRGHGLKLGPFELGYVWIEVDKGWHGHCPTTDHRTISFDKAAEAKSALEAHIRNALGGFAWGAPRPMAEAPRDGTWVLAQFASRDTQYRPPLRFVIVSFRTDEPHENWWRNAENEIYLASDFAGWLPLPGDHVPDAGKAPEAPQDGEREKAHVRWVKEPGLLPMLRAGTYTLGHAYSVLNGWEASIRGHSELIKRPSEAEAQRAIEEYYGLPDLPKISTDTTFPKGGA